MTITRATSDYIKVQISAFDFKESSYENIFSDTIIEKEHARIKKEKRRLLNYLIN